jgi:hypothetical protein
MRRSTCSLPSSYWVTVLALGLMACSAEPTRVVEMPGSASLGKGASTTGPTVTATDPAYGERGTRIQVHVKGAGFNSSAQATWERNGAIDPRVTVLSTTFVSSSEVVADLQIGSDADVDLYDVAVSVLVSDGSRKKGVGIELFTVTVVQSIPGVVTAWSINDGGQVVGQYGKSSAFIWDPAAGLTVIGVGQALDLDDAGAVVVGNYYDGTVNHGTAWTRGASGWSSALLSTSCVSGAIGSTAPAIAPDGSLIGGRVVVPVSRKTNKALPAVWDGPTSPCRILALPPGRDAAYIKGVSAAGTVAGAATAGGVSSAVVWDASGVPTILGSLGGTYDEIRGFSRNGTMAVGISNSVAVLWIRADAGWSAPIALPCGSWATAVNDYGMVLGKGCDGGRWWQMSGSTVVAQGLMPGYGPSDPHPAAEEITNNTLSGQPWAAGGTGFWRIP